MIDALTKGINIYIVHTNLLFILNYFCLVLVGLYEEPERPSNAVDYIKRYMGAPAGVDVEALRIEVEQLRADKAALEATVRDLSAKVYTVYNTNNIL